MAISSAKNLLLRFGLFELEVESGELRRERRPVRLRPQAAKVLALLASGPGKVITREELRDRVWGSNTFVDFEHGINLCIREIRAALNDDADRPQYIQTLPKRGYRFIAQVEAAASEVPPAESIRIEPALGSVESLIQPPSSPPPIPFWRARIRMIVVVAIGALALLFVALPGRWRERIFRGLHGQIRSIAVLPLENLSGDATQEYFADGMTDALTTELARMGSQAGALTVISRTSVMQYKRIHKPMRQIANELKVDAVVEGSVQRSGERMGINVQLIDARTDRHIWARAYERDLRDVLTLQREVAEAIGSEIRVKLTPEEQAHLAKTLSINLASHDSYLQGRFQLEKWSGDGARAAIEYFDEAIQQDPRNALAYAGIAETYVWASGDPLLWAEAIPKAKVAATKALEIDATLAEPRTALAMIELYNDWDFSGAEREFQRAIAANPNYAPAHHWYSHCLMATGRFKEALAQSQAFLKVDPLSPAANLHLAWTYLDARQLDEAVEQFQTTLRMDPNYVEAHHGLAQAYLRLGRNEEAVAEVQQAVALSGGGALYLGTLGEAYAKAGRRAEAQKVLAEMLDQSKRGHVSPYPVAVVYAALEERDHTFEWLDKAFNERSKVLIELRESADFDSLRSDPRFAALLRRIGLPG